MDLSGAVRDEQVDGRAEGEVAEHGHRADRQEAAECEQDRRDRVGARDAGKERPELAQWCEG